MHGLGRSWAAGFWLFLVAYFAYHAFHGDNSIHALRALQQQEIELLATAREVNAQHDYLLVQTSALARSSVDPDMLEEQVRARLGFAHPDEVIVLTN